MHSIEMILSTLIEAINQRIDTRMIHYQEVTRLDQEEIERDGSSDYYDELQRISGEISGLNYSVQIIQAMKRMLFK